MGAQQKTWVCAKDKTIRVDNKTGQGDGDYLFTGRTTTGTDHVHRVLLQFTKDWNGVGQIIKGELALTSSSQSIISFGSAPKIGIRKYTQPAWSEGNAGNNEWHSNDYSPPGGVTLGMASSIAVVTTELHTTYFDITPYIEAIAPASVKKRDGTPGDAQTDTGLLVRTPDESKAGQRMEWLSRNNGTAGRRPQIRLTYDVGSVAPDAPTLLTPSGDTEPNEEFTGLFVSAQDADVIDQVEVRLWDNAGTTMIWSGVSTTSEAQRLAGTFAVPFPESLKSLTDYKWDARVADQTGQWSAYAAKVSFKVTNTAPVVTVVAPPASVDTLRNYLFRADYSDADGDGLGVFRMQFRTQTAEGNPAWGDTLLWDSDWISGVTVVRDGIPSVVIETEYGGRALAAGTYSFRIKARDTRSGESAWDYADIVLSANYEPDGASLDNMTGFARKSAQFRIVLREVDKTAGRGPKATPVAVITDASNIGAATYANSPGEFFFTLPIDHPQIGACEPYQTHYAVEQYVGDQWIERFAGLLDDFDATDDEIVFHGVDYLGLLAMSVDERYDKAKPEKSYTDGGSKYTDVQIHTMIGDLIDTGKAQTDSTYGFITRPTSGSLWEVLPERVSLTTTYNQHLSTISGLLDSHKQGTGVRTRLWVQRTAPQTYRWRLTDDYGKDRENIRLEYGGLINGFRLVAFGDYGSMVHGIGRIREQLKPYYEKAESPINDGISTATGVWGRVSKAAVWQDLQDENDLKRRVQEMAMKVGKIGKRVALAIRVGDLDPFDGYDIYDSVPVIIQRGAVDTQRFGSGLWTIHGVAWKLYPDGHADLTLTVLPKEDGSSVDPDLLAASIPILREEDWQIGFVPPDATNSGRWWFDAASGSVWRWDEDLQEWVKYDWWGSPSLTVVDPDNPLKQIRMMDGVLMITIDGGVNWTPYLTGDGSDAGGISWGNLPGGSNLIPDGSFELAAFPTAVETAIDWDTDTHFGSNCTLTRMSISGSGTAAVIQLTSAS